MLGDRLLIPLQLPLSPVRIFTISKRSLDVAVQSAQHPDACGHHEVAAFGCTDQATDRGLPFFDVLLSLWQLHDVNGGILKRNELAPAGQRYRIIKLSFPAAAFSRRPSESFSGGMGFPVA